MTRMFGFTTGALLLCAVCYIPGTSWGKLSSNLTSFLLSTGSQSKNALLRYRKPSLEPGSRKDAIRKFKLLRKHKLCLPDLSDVGRTLSSGGYNDNANMTIENCINYCSTHGYIYAGTEYSAECYCGMNIASAATTAPSTDCGMPCTGNSTEPCGGGNRLNMFWSNTTGPQTNPGPGNWTFSGCYT